MTILVLLLLLQTASSFRLAPLSPSTIIPSSQRSKASIILSLGGPPDPWDDEKGPLDVEPMTDEGQGMGIPKLQVPKLSVPKFDIDIKDITKKLGVVALTVAAFVAIQKIGLIVSGVVTPELSLEDIQNFNL